MATELAAQLAQLLSALSSTDNAARSAAETQLDDGLAKAPADLLSGLAHLARVAPDSEVLSHAGLFFFSCF